MSYFDDGLTLDEAKQQYRLLARRNHPDILKDDGMTMVAINTEYEHFKLRKERPVLGVAAPAPGANPMAWFAAMKQAAHVAAAAAPEDLRRSAQQAAAHAPSTMGGSPPPPAYTYTPPPASTYTPQPAYTYTPQPVPGSPSASTAPATAAAPSTATATPPRTRAPRAPRAASPTRPIGPRQSSAQRIAQKEEEDYDRARNTSRDTHGHRRFGDVVIFWEDTTYDRLECVAILTAANPRHEIRRNGTVVHTERATRSWQAERRLVIERATRLI